MSMDMSEMTGMEHSGSDYAEFEYQVFNIEHSTGRPPTNPLGDIVYNFDPIQEFGGLDNNEVAELVYSEIQVGLETEEEQGDQTAASSIEARGFFGANLDSTNVLIQNSENTVDVVDTNGQNLLVGQNGGTRSRDEIFQPYQVHGTQPFDGIADGTGGGGNLDDQTFIKNWRELVGRGPVLDSNDNLAVAERLIAGDKAPDTTVRSQIRGHLVWDIAEVNDAGRQFSVP
jgi:hypothetical protein